MDMYPTKLIIHVKAIHHDYKDHIFYFTQNSNLEIKMVKSFPIQSDILKPYR